MGMLSRNRRNRANLRAHTSALKSKARAEAKAAAKEARLRAREAHKVELAEAKKRAKLAHKSAGKRAKIEDKLAAKQAKQAARTDSAIAKADRKHLKKESAVVSKERKKIDKIARAGRKHEYQLAEMELKKAEAGKLGKKDVQRWLNIAQAATPVLIPLIYKAVSTIGPSTGGSASEARAAGIDATGPGAALGGRLVRVEQTLGQLEAKHGTEPKVRDFVASTRTRLDDLRVAIESAETVPTYERREIHKSISGEIDRLNRDVLAHLGVTA